MRKNEVKLFMVLFLYLPLFFINLSAISSKEQVNFNNFLYSEDIQQKEKAYYLIIGDRNKYKDLILNELNKYAEGAHSIPDELIYIAAYIRDKRFIPSLVKFLENREYSYDQCIYSCPIVFALTIYACFSPHSLPSALNTDLTPVWDLMREIEWVKNISLKPVKPNDLVCGPGIDADLKKGEFMTTEQLIILAGPNNDGTIPRFAASVILSCRIDNEQHLPDLYWLAISEQLDASMQYRDKIYWAIYKAETALLRKEKRINKEAGQRPHK